MTVGSITSGTNYGAQSITASGTPITGGAFSASSTAGSASARAQAIATGAVAGQLAQSIGNALNLDTFEINVAPENGGGPELTLGQRKVPRSHGLQIVGDPAHLGLTLMCEGGDFHERVRTGEAVEGKRKVVIVDCLA